LEVAGRAGGAAAQLCAQQFARGCSASCHAGADPQAVAGQQLAATGCCWIAGPQAVHCRPLAGEQQGWRGRSGVVVVYLWRPVPPPSPPPPPWKSPEPPPPLHPLRPTAPLLRSPRGAPAAAGPAAPLCPASSRSLGA
jgi:hypothetical protein